MNLKQFLNELKLHKDSERAIIDKNYHKSNREHWGIPVPLCVDITRSLSKGLSQAELLSLATELWQTNIYDAMVCCAKILLRVKPSKELWQTIVYFLTFVDGWALEDHMAKAAAKCILADESLLDELENWTKHPNFWMRRAALVYTLPYAKPKHDPERMLKWAAGYVADKEWFIQKAIGWWLRDLSAHDPKRVIAFVNTHQLKGVARKEATRKLKKPSLE